MNLSLFRFFWWAPWIFFHLGLCGVTFRPFKVIQGRWFWHQSKARTCDFLLVHHSSHGHIFHRFGDIAGFLCSTLILGVFPLHHIVRVGVNVSSRWNYFRSIPTCVKIIPQRHKQTDRQTDRQTTYCGITALCVASHGKTVCNIITIYNINYADIL